MPTIISNFPEGRRSTHFCSCSCHISNTTQVRFAWTIRNIQKLENLQLSGAIIRLDLTDLREVTERFLDTGIISGSFRLRAISAIIVRVFPSPMSSARSPPLKSGGGAHCVSPVIVLTYLW
jgi:hypothetical protein